MSFKIVLNIVLALCLTCVAGTVSAQETEIQAFNDIVEQIAESSDEELDYTTLYETLMQYYNDPIDLNQTTADELDKLMFLTFYQARSIIKYREKFKGFKSLYELRFVDGIDEQTLNFLLHFVSVGIKYGNDKADWKKMLTYGKHDVFLRSQFTLQQRAGYDEIPDSVLVADPDKSRYLGSPYKLYTRYRYHYKDKIFWGITAEKDAGEEFFRGSQPYGFDYYSAHLQVNGLGPVTTAILGDYQVEFGQGLTLWSGMTYGKGSNPNDIIKRGRGISRYGSANENEFLRGQAAMFTFGKFTLTEFLSYNAIDASIDSDTTYDEEEAWVSSFLNSGYHRTPSELASKNTVKQSIAGANLSYKADWYHLGLTLAAFNLSENLTGNPAPYNYFGFRGTQGANAGLNYMIYRGIFTAFGETSVSENLAFATLNGASLNLIPEVNISVLHRYFEPDYHALYAAPFSEGGKPSNESGFYLGATIYPIKRWRLDLYTDIWKYPWLRYGVSAPTTGKEYLAQLNYSPTRYVDMLFRVKYETKQRNNSLTELGVHDITDYSVMRVRYHIAVDPGRGFMLKTRLEWSRYQLGDAGPENGFLMYQDFSYAFQRIPLQLTARIALFNTDSYNTAIYAWEPDVLYAFSVPAYYDRGSKLVLVVKYSLGENLDFWLRVAQTQYSFKNSIGSGLDEIEGNFKTDINLQLRYSF